MYKESIICLKPQAEEESTNELESWIPLDYKFLFSRYNSPIHFIPKSLKRNKTKRVSMSQLEEILSQLEICLKTVPFPLYTLRMSSLEKSGFIEELKDLFEEEKEVPINSKCNRVLAKYLSEAAYYLPEELFSELLVITFFFIECVNEEMAGAIEEYCSYMPAGELANFANFFIVDFALKVERAFGPSLSIKAEFMKHLTNWLFEKRFSDYYVTKIKANKI